VTPRYGEPTDEHMRELILRELSRRRIEFLGLAEQPEGKARDMYFSDGIRLDAASRAASHRRQAAHYQQAIDLLSAAHLPPEV
jgi:hypothetical protein